MSLPSSSNTIQHIGDGVTTVFSFPYLTYNTEHVKVYLDDVLTLTGFTVSSIPPEGALPTVTFTVPPASGVKLTIKRVVPVTQLSTYATGGAFPAKTVEKNFDLATMAIQQIQEGLDRSIQLSVSSTLPTSLFPDVSDPANYGKGLKIKDDGTGFDLYNIETSPVTSPLTTKGDLYTFSSAAARLPVGTDGQVLSASSVAGTGLAWTAISLPVPNSIINGNFDVWQRGTSFPNRSSADPGSRYFADRWIFSIGSSGAVCTVSRSTDVPTVAQAGMLVNYSHRVLVTTLDNTIGSTEFVQIVQKVEGFNWRQLAQRPLTLSFWVKSSKTGTHGVAVSNNAATKSFVAGFTVIAADTWEYKTISIPASPAAGVWNYTDGGGANIIFSLLTGSNLIGTPNVWQDGNFQGVPGQVNLMDTVANQFLLTNVKLEAGNLATPYTFEPFEQTLLRCLRYCEKSFPYNIAPAQNAGNIGACSMQIQGVPGNVGTYMYIPFKVMKRAVPIITTYNPSAANALVRNVILGADTTLNSQSIVGEQGFRMAFESATGSSEQQMNGLHWLAEAETY